MIPYVLHTDGLCVLLPDGEVLAYPVHPDGVCVPCTLRYRLTHGLSLDTADLTRLLNPPDDAEHQLEALEARAWQLQKDNPFEPQSARTALLEVDETKQYPHQAFGRITVMCAATYQPVFEKQLFFGHAAWVKRVSNRKPVAKLAYWVWFDYHGLRLFSREEALFVIRNRALPAGVNLPPQPAPPTEEEIDALFAKIGGASQRARPDP